MTLREEILVHEKGQPDSPLPTLKPSCDFSCSYGNWSLAQEHLASLTASGPCDGLILSAFFVSCGLFSVDRAATSGRAKPCEQDPAVVC